MKRKADVWVVLGAYRFWTQKTDLGSFGASVRTLGSVQYLCFFKAVLNVLNNIKIAFHFLIIRIHLQCERDPAKQRFYVLLERRIITSIQQAMFPACPVKQLINDLIIIVMPILPMNILALL